MRVLTCGIVLLAFGVMGETAVCAQTISLNVPGTSSPYLAGLPDGTILIGGSGPVDYDTAPEASPVLVTGLDFGSTSVLNFSATGRVNNAPGNPFLGPDGAGPLYSHAAAFGIGSVTSPYDSLLGVFLDDNRPDLTPAPSAFVYGVDVTAASVKIAPTLKQVFYIGDGLSSSGTLQRFVVPAGATRLYLGVFDQFGWKNNGGSFDVTVTGVTAAPEPGALALLSLIAIPAFALIRRR